MRVRSHTQNGRKYLFYSPYTKVQIPLLWYLGFFVLFNNTRTCGINCHPRAVIAYAMSEREHYFAVIRLCVIYCAGSNPVTIHYSLPLITDIFNFPVQLFRK